MTRQADPDLRRHTRRGLGAARVTRLRLAAGMWSASKQLGVVSDTPFHAMGHSAFSLSRYAVEIRRVLAIIIYYYRDLQSRALGGVGYCGGFVWFQWFGIEPLSHGCWSKNLGASKELGLVCGRLIHGECIPLRSHVVWRFPVPDRIIHPLSGCYVGSLGSI